MHIRRDPDGSVEIHEIPAVMRGALLAGAAAIPWATWAGAVDASDPLRVVLGILGGAMFLASALLVEGRWYRFDRQEGVVRWRRSRLLSSRSGSLPFGAVVAVVPQARMDDDNPRTRRVSYRPVMLTSEGEMLLSNQTSLKAEDFADLLSTVRGALGLTSTQERGQVVDLVAAGRIVDAVALLRRQRGVSLAEAKSAVEAIRSRLEGRESA